MEQFRTYLHQEFVSRTSKNPSYSLRAFARHLGINHATLSSLLSGKRKITLATIQKIGRALDLGPMELARFTNSSPLGIEKEKKFNLIQQDVFAFMSDWYFDAILELSMIPKFKLNPDLISQALSISRIQAEFGLNTLVRLGLLVKEKSGQYKLQYHNSINILDPDFTSVANRKYQKSILNKSTEALENVERKMRDHTSTTMAINTDDLPKVKELIQKFRHDLNAYLQRAEIQPNQVYQLQISFFPVSKNLKLKKRRR